MPCSTKEIQEYTIRLKEKYVTRLNKKNLAVSFVNRSISIRASILRFNPIFFLILMCVTFYVLFKVSDEPYLTWAIAIIVFFAAIIWTELATINKLKIDLVEQSLSISHLNYPRYLLLRWILKYSNRYGFGEIEKFSLVEKYYSIHSKNYIVMHLADGDEYKLIDVPDKTQAATLVNLLNEILNAKELSG